MTTVREQLIQVIFAEITLLNGDNTEEDLNMVISRTIADEKLKNTKLVTNKSLIAEQLESEVDIEKIEPKNAWIYSEGTTESWLFDKFDTIADAVRAAVKMINTKVICEGKIVTYDTLSDTEAYYIDNRDGKVKLVNLNK